MAQRQRAIVHGADLAQKSFGRRAVAEAFTGA
jgi:hypothetical protein